MIGEVDTDAQLLRSNAQPGELLFVSGTLGDAAAGLEQFEKKVALNQYNQYLIERFFRPTARVDIGHAIMDYASSSIDISDGLIGDLKKIMSASDVGALINIEDIPLSKEMLKIYEPKKSQTFALSGGDDYELLFTAPAENFSKIMDISKEKDQIVFLLWGKFAESKLKLIDSCKHKIFVAPHPSPLGAWRGWFGSKHFSKTNNYLEKNNKQIINW